DFVPNFDDQRQEPTVLPAKVPNLLINGSSGIAVGMATNIPPHNLREVAAALKYLVAHPDCTVDDLIRRLPGPDFPTGGFILGTEGIREAYRTGRGRIVMRARVQKETRRNGKEQLVVTELPYGVSKARLVEQIAELVRDRKLEDIADLRDESDREGMRVVIELKRGAHAGRVLAQLYKHTPLQTTFGAILLALDRGVPREFNLKELLERYRDHRLEVIRRRARYELEQARKEAHTVEGLLIALAHIDAVVALIRRAKDREDAARKLRKRFGLSEAQADAILDMRLARLTALEARQLEKRLEELKKQIADLEKLLESEQRQLETFVAELNEMVARYGDARRTTIIRAEQDFEVEDVQAEEDVVVAVSHQGYAWRIPMALYRRRAARGNALAGLDRHDGDFLEHAFIATTRDTLLLFTADGQAHALPVARVPEAGRTGRGRPLAQLLGLNRRAAIAAIVAVSGFDAERSLVFLTAGGLVKRTALDQFAGIRAGGIKAIEVRKGDRLIEVQPADGARDLIVVTRQGRAIRFPLSEVPLLGRTAQGVKGIQLRPQDEVVGMVLARRQASLCTITEQGYAKRTPLAAYPVQRRGGVGTVTLEVTQRTGPLVAARELLPGDELMIIASDGASARVGAGEIPEQRRATQGKRVFTPGDGARVIDVARVAAEREERRDEQPALTEETAPEQLELVGLTGE
ncbi:MAG TPA: DNA gyrase subunit A, partial [Longimicrobiales bacterium]